MRQTTERGEGIKAGTAILVGTDKNKIFEVTKNLLTNKKGYDAIAKKHNPYGDGKTSSRILKIIKRKIK